ncbi:DUF3408 domain-containing protein [Dysgonomonas gadei]|uniref:DUF3408 domain-containing protein n=1 Tax=Dysgonomonas gadei ATCC BAA-286 TaxID=742766 RepID=F5IVB7_9BACT|nr:DUF3408 domain-containing protein [Dysgonomonas gadei]EGK02567.1 hypothetical protein HMPREF9455_00817 [Dysgonomonas gadei ATCC BAA-286]
MSKKIDTSGIDTTMVISQSKKGNRENPPAPISEAKDVQQPPQTLVEENETEKEDKVSREEPKRRETKTQEYENLFFKAASIKTRNGKVVYIRKEHHDRIMKIVRVIGENEFSLFNYLDNILENHFATYQDEITKLYRKRNTDVF